jgi:ribonuclease P protein component
VRKKEDFKQIRRAGRRVVGKWVFFDVLSEKIPYPRLGITVSKKFGPANLRNLFKRRVREAFRLSHLPPGTTLHVSPKQEKSVPTVAQLLEEFSYVK